MCTGVVPERFPLDGKVSVTGGYAEEEGIVFFEFGGGDEGDGGVLARCVHLGKDVFGEGFFDSGSEVWC